MSAGIPNPCSYIDQPARARLGRMVTAGPRRPAAAEQPLRNGCSESAGRRGPAEQPLVRTGRPPDHVGVNMQRRLLVTVSGPGRGSGPLVVGVRSGMIITVGRFNLAAVRVRTRLANSEPAGDPEKSAPGARVLMTLGLVVGPTTRLSCKAPSCLYTDGLGSHHPGPPGPTVPPGLQVVVPSRDYRPEAASVGIAHDKVICSWQAAVLRAAHMSAQRTCRAPLCQVLCQGPRT
jgi:hypothetical protein